jgi:hypothetical protein
MPQHRAISVGQLLRKKFKTIPLTGHWQEAIGTPEANGIWLVWGQSGNGKTRLSLMLAEMLAQYGKVAYNTLEEGARLSFQKAIRETGFNIPKGRFTILNREPMDELIVRLKKRKSPDIVIIDSLQYSFLTRRSYFELKQALPNKLIIFISHAAGKDPDGDLAKKVRYDADVKIYVEGYMAFITSRYGGGKPITIWKEGAERFHGTQID